MCRTTVGAAGREGLGAGHAIGEALGLTHLAKDVERSRGELAFEEVAGSPPCRLTAFVYGWSVTGSGGVSAEPCT